MLHYKTKQDLDGPKELKIFCNFYKKSSDDLVSSSTKIVIGPQYENL
jgi:hypothetical protein